MKARIPLFRTVKVPNVGRAYCQDDAQGRWKLLKPGRFDSFLQISTDTSNVPIAARKYEFLWEHITIA